MHASMWVYPWDLLDEGEDKVLTRLSEVGLNSLSVAVSYHAGKFLRPHNPKGKVYFPEDGVVYFRPHLERYDATPIKPQPGALVEKADLFESLPARARDHGLNLVAWTVCLHNTRLGTKYPDYTVRNAFGDAYPYNLCPSRPEVREYVKALVADISSHGGLYAVELETPGFLEFEHGCHHEMYGLELSSLASFLLSLCFCKGCVRSAHARGIDAEAVRMQVRDLLTDYFESDGPTQQTEDVDFVQSLSPESELHKYLALRCSLVTDVVKGAKEAVSPEVKLFVIPALSKPCSLAWREGAELAALAEHVDAIEVVSYLPQIADVRADVGMARRIIGEEAKLHVGLRPSYPDTISVHQLAEKVKAAKVSGADGLSFYNYGHMRLADLRWIQEALAWA